MLVINTAFMTANLGLQDANGTQVIRTIDAKSKHSENVLKTIDEMCQEAGVGVLDLETIAIVTGPGSFTGLRIGVAVAKALGCVNDKLKFLSLSSLNLMAYIIAKQRKMKGNFVCAINALSDLYFVAYFNKNGINLQEERMIDKQEFSSISLEKVALYGDLDDEELTFVEVTSQDLLDYALEMEKQGKFVCCDDLLPKYLRLSQAEDNLLKKKQKH